MRIRISRYAETDKPTEQHRVLRSGRLIGERVRNEAELPTPRPTVYTSPDSRVTNATPNHGALYGRSAELSSCDNVQGIRANHTADPNPSSASPRGHRVIAASNSARLEQSTYPNVWQDGPATSTVPSGVTSSTLSPLPPVRLGVSPSPFPYVSSHHENWYDSHIPTDSTGTMLGQIDTSSPIASIDHSIPHRSVTQFQFVPPGAQPGEPGYTKRPRGTTGNVVCERCGVKFTEPSSLTRHNKTTLCGKAAGITTTLHNSNGAPKRGHLSQIHQESSMLNEAIDTVAVAGPKDDISRLGSQVMGLASGSGMILDADATHPISYAQNASSLSDYNIASTPMIVAAGNAQIVQTQSVVPSVAMHGSLTSYVPGRYTPLVVATGDAQAAQIPSMIPSLNNQRPLQRFIAEGTRSAQDYEFNCDICPESFPRRYSLQLHKSSTHDVVEAPDSRGTIDMQRPWYLVGATYENSSDHRRRALQVWEEGGLSGEPCKPCSGRGLDCVVSAFISTKCAFCNHRDNGMYCGAAGVMFR